MVLWSALRFKTPHISCVLQNTAVNKEKLQPPAFAPPVEAIIRRAPGVSELSGTIPAIRVFLANGCSATRALGRHRQLRERSTIFKTHLAMQGAGWPPCHPAFGRSNLATGLLPPPLKCPCIQLAEWMCMWPCETRSAAFGMSLQA